LYEEIDAINCSSSFDACNLLLSVESLVVAELGEFDEEVCGDNDTETETF